MGDLTTEDKIEMTIRRVQRMSADSAFVNTLNVADRVTLDFVWFPGADDVTISLIDVILPLADAAPRDIQYRWARKGMADIVRNMATGRITLELAPGSTGVLTVFDTQWKITRARTGVSLSPAGGLKGIQQRLNILGYHLRAPGVAGAGIDGHNGATMERALLSFQVDFRKPAGAPAAAPAGPLRVRGEPLDNPDLTVLLAVYNHTDFTLVTNPSAADAAQVQQALVAIVGA